MNRFDQFVADLPVDTRESVKSASESKVVSRRETLARVFPDPAEARRSAAAIKAFVLDNLKALLTQLEGECEKNGVRIHWAQDAAEARKVILDICRAAAPSGSTVVKAKSMATEEIHLNRSLIDDGYEVVETDLGEYVVQIDGDTPSHIVTPIIHKDRSGVAASFFREGLGPYTESPEALTLQARAHLRSKFKRAKVGISGVNFAIAESGRLVLVENEGNNRFSTTAPGVHIALMGIEKVLPREADLPLFLRLLAGSATGQNLTVYTHLIRGPRQSDEMDGPDEVHLVILDNGRSRALAGPYRDVLRCIRCGACLNTCPVYRHGSGHAYGHVYSGPIGAVLAPALEGVRAFGHLAKASSLCGACEEVCPVAIPIPELLLKLRDESARAGVGGNGVAWSVLAKMAANGGLWRTTLKLLPMATSLPNPWSKYRDNPKRVGRDFRRWFRERS